MEMKVKDLVEKLTKLDQDSFIYFSRHDDFEDDNMWDSFEDIMVSVSTHSVSKPMPPKQ